MAAVKLFWDPEGKSLNSLGGTELLRITDGDTPYVSTAIRLLSIDTPEVHYPGNSDPARLDDNFAELAAWIAAGQAPLDDGLAAHLTPRLSAGNVGRRQKEQGKAATQALQQLIDAKLSKPNGGKRQVYLHSGDETFDQYGRLLAYMAPYYDSDERATLSEKERATFNLLMVDAGWAATFPIYPSLPRYRDLVLLQECARDAVEQRRGIWADPATLTGYEFRMCYQLWDVARQLTKGKKLPSREREGWVDRYCVDMTTREIFEPAQYYRVAPYNRVFIWPRDVAEAVATLNLAPPET
jgi:endonuclease YncB( thermonuclease family)